MKLIRGVNAISVGSLWPWKERGPSAENPVDCLEFPDCSKRLQCKRKKVLVHMLCPYRVAFMREKVKVKQNNKIWKGFPLIPQLSDLRFIINRYSSVIKTDICSTGKCLTFF